MSHQPPPEPPGDEPGVVFARTREGYALPVIDVTHPRFALPGDAATVQRLTDALAAEEHRRRLIPPFIMRMMLAAAARQSRLVRAIYQSDRGFLDSISTYVMKLGADNLVPPYDTAVDRRVASSPHTPLLRLRMQQIAHLAAAGLADDLAARRGAPLTLIAIGGGPALDAVNAVIVLRRDRPELLDRRIAITVLDADADGAVFGAGAVAALEAHGPLAGLDITMAHHDYDWNRPAALAAVIADGVGAGAVIAATSEGALFEYGSDQAIVENLQALRAGGVRHVAGSVTNAADAVRRRMIDQARLGLKPRGLDGIAPLFAAGGFGVVASAPTFFSTQVLLQAQQP